MTTLIPAVIVKKLERYADRYPCLREKFVDLMIENLLELQQSVSMSSQYQNSDIFRKACQKGRITLSMLDCVALTDVVEQLKSDITNNSKTVLFNQICKVLIQRLDDFKNGANSTKN